MSTHISATEAARTFSDLLNRIRYRGEEFVVERGGEAVCRMTPPGPPEGLTLRGLISLLKDTPKPDSGFASAVKRAARQQGRPPRSPWER